MKCTVIWLYRLCEYIPLMLLFTITFNLLSRYFGPGDRAAFGMPDGGKEERAPKKDGVPPWFYCWLFDLIGYWSEYGSR